MFVLFWVIKISHTSEIIQFLFISLLYHLLNYIVCLPNSSPLSTPLGLEVNQSHCVLTKVKSNLIFVSRSKEEESKEGIKGVYKAKF